MKIAVTGAAGFIGFHLSSALASIGVEIVGIDSLPTDENNISRLRARKLESSCEVKIVEMDLSKAKVEEISQIISGCEIVIHLAAQAGVSNSVKFPEWYFASNILGFNNILQAVQITKPQKFVYASSSSVYGNQKDFLPFKESFANGLNLNNFYGTTKWINELIAGSMYQNEEVKTIGLRFFTVYGEWGRPDMVYTIFARNLIENRHIEIYGENGGTRSFTHVSDVVAIILKICKSQMQETNKVLNVGNPLTNSTRNLLEILQQNIPSESTIMELPPRLVYALQQEASPSLWL